MNVVRPARACPGSPWNGRIATFSTPAAFPSEEDVSPPDEAAPWRSLARHAPRATAKTTATASPDILQCEERMVDLPFVPPRGIRARGAARPCRPQEAGARRTVRGRAERPAARARGACRAARR